MTRNLELRQLELRPRAERDIVVARQWYDQQRLPLGTEFLDEAFRTIRNVVSSPFQYPVIYRQTRRALLTRFPFALYFRTSGNTVVVVGVLHTRRNPRKWQIRESVLTYQELPVAA